MTKEAQAERERIAKRFLLFARQMQEKEFKEDRDSAEAFGQVMNAALQFMLSAVTPAAFSPLEGVDLIAIERIRQVSEEGWTPEHDDEHSEEEMAFCAAQYATPERHRRFEFRTIGLSNKRVPLRWPWEAQSWKPAPDDRIRELVKAGALIAAEIDRLHRAL